MDDLVSLLKQAHSEKSHVVGDWLNLGELALIFAGRGVGKTYIALILAHSIACGNNFLHFRSNKHRVLYLDGEMGKAALARRLSHIENNGDLLEPLNARTFFVHSFEDCLDSTMWNLSDPAAQNLYDKIIDESRADVIIIDNLNTCHSLLSNSDSDLNAWMRIQKWAIKKRLQGKSIVFIHHAGKSGAQLGTSQRENIMDVIIELKKSRIDPMLGFNSIEWHVSKIRDLAPEKLYDMYIEYSLSESGATINSQPLKDKKYSFIRTLSHSGFTKAQIAERMNVAKWIVEDALRTEEVEKIEDKNFDLYDDLF